MQAAERAAHNAKDNACNNAVRWSGACLDDQKQITHRNNKKDSKRRERQYLRVCVHNAAATTDALTRVLWTTGAEQLLGNMELEQTAADEEDGEATTDALTVLSWTTGTEQPSRNVELDNDSNKISLSDVRNRLFSWCFQVQVVKVSHGEGALQCRAVAPSDVDRDKTCPSQPL